MFGGPSFLVRLSCHNVSCQSVGWPFQSRVDRFPPFALNFWLGVYFFKVILSLDDSFASDLPYQVSRFWYQETRFSGVYSFTSSVFVSPEGDIESRDTVSSPKLHAFVVVINYDTQPQQVV